MKHQFYTYTLLILVAALLPLSSFAQNNAKTEKTTLTINESDNSNRMASIKAVPELHKQLVVQFGENFSLESNEVRAQLKTNFENPKASSALRRTSLYAYYGDDYKNYINQISNRK